MARSTDLVLATRISLPRVFVKKKEVFVVYWNLRRPVCGLFGCDQYDLLKRICFVFNAVYLC